MGNVVKLADHARAPSGSAGASRACIAAKASSVTSLHPRSPASRTKAAQCGAGIPPARSRQPLTVDLETRSASATCVVPPSASMIDPGVAIIPLIVRTTRTSQGFADRETTFSAEHVPISGMIDPPKVIGPRLKDLRRVLEIKTQVEFAQAIGVEKNTYNPWEKGKRDLTFEGACLIRKKYGIPLDYLFFGSMDGLPDWVRIRLLKKAAA